MKRILLAAGLIALLSQTAMAQTPELVCNVATGTDDSNPSYLIETNGKLFWVAYDDDHGSELWMKPPNDTARLAKDILPGAVSSLIDHMIGMNGKVYFMATDGTTPKLWMSDGTDAGTVVLKDMQMLTYDPIAGYGGIVYNNKLYFNGSDNGSEYELWVTDGTTAGTQLVKDINPGPISSSPTLFTVYNGLLYFTALDNTNGRQLWLSDGTAPGTHMVSLINATGDASPGPKAVYNNRLYFGADDGTHGIEMWSTDGSDTGTHMLKDMNPGTGIGGYRPVVSGGKLYFIGDDGTTGLELAVSDGTAAGTQIVKDINPGSSSSSLRNLTDLNGKLYFGAKSTNPSELWLSDGTQAGTQLVHTLATAAPNTIIDEMLTYHNKLYFTVSRPVTGRDLWQSDGTDAGTTIINVNPPHNNAAVFGTPPNMAVCDDSLYFAADYGTAGLEVYRIGTPGLSAGMVHKNELNAGLYPNPASNNVALNFYLDDAATVNLLLTDLAGRSIYTSTRNKVNPGNNTLTLDLPAGLSPGLYFICISSVQASSTLRLIVE